MADEVLQIGYIKKYINDRGFGFIQDVFTDNEYFFHFKVFNTPDLDTYQENEKLYLFKIQNSSKESGRKEVSSIQNLENNIIYSDIVKILDSFDEKNIFNFIKSYHIYIKDKFNLKRKSNKLFIFFSNLVKNDINLIEYFHSSHPEIVSFYNEDTYVNNKIIKYIKFFGDDDNILLKNKIESKKINLLKEDYILIYINNLHSFMKIINTIDLSILENISINLLNNHLILNINQHYLSKIIELLYKQEVSFKNKSFLYKIKDFKYISLNNYLNLYYLFNYITQDNLNKNINEYTQIFNNIEIIDLFILPKCKGRSNIKKVTNDLEVFYQISTNNETEFDFRGMPISCEGRLATNVRDNIPPEYSKYWCRNKLCYEVAFIENSEIEFNKISGFVNKFNLKIKHLRCTKCLKLLKPMNNSNYNYYFNNYFRCNYSDCENFQKETKSKDRKNDKIIYIHHCNNFKCEGIIDSRFSDACSNNWIICNKCNYCCNNKTKKDIENRKILLNQTKVNFKTHQNYISFEGNKLKLDDNTTKFFCHKCGEELKSALEEYVSMFNWLKNESIKDDDKKQDNKYFYSFGVTEFQKYWWRVSDTTKGQELKTKFGVLKYNGFDIVDNQLITGFKPSHEKYNPRFICENKCEGIKNQEDYKKLDDYYNETIKKITSIFNNFS